MKILRLNFCFRKDLALYTYGPAGTNDVGGEVILIGGHRSKQDLAAGCGRLNPGPNARAEMIRQIRYEYNLHPGGSIRSSRQHLARWLKMPCGS